MAEGRATVRLTLETPETLGDLRAFMAKAVTLGMPDKAVVHTETVSKQAIVLSAFLSDLEEQ